MALHIVICELGHGYKSTPQLEMWAFKYLPIHAVILIGFILCWSYTGGHSCCEFLSTQYYNVQKTLFHPILPYLWIL